MRSFDIDPVPQTRPMPRHHFVMIMSTCHASGCGGKLIFKPMSIARQTTLVSIGAEVFPIGPWMWKLSPREQGRGGRLGEISVEE